MIIYSQVLSCFSDLTKARLAKCNWITHYYYHKQSSFQLLIIKTIETVSLPTQTQPLPFVTEKPHKLLTSWHNMSRNLWWKRCCISWETACGTWLWSRQGPLEVSLLPKEKKKKKSAADLLQEILPPSFWFSCSLLLPFHMFLSSLLCQMDLSEFVCEAMV